MALYAAAKFVAYSLWCWVGLRLSAPAHASVGRSLKYGAFRWLLGLAFGVVRGPRTWLWILGGIVVSFASDLLSPEGMAGRFCVGRCLC
jgi:hypothetical protein